MISTRTILQLIFWTTTFNFISVSKGSEDYISIWPGDRVTVSPNEAVKFECESTQPVTWKAFDQFKGTLNIRKKIDKGTLNIRKKIDKGTLNIRKKSDSSLYVIELVLTNITYHDVGTYFCIQNDSISEDLKDSSTERLIDAEKAAKTYLFVNDPDNPLAEMQGNTIYGSLYSRVLIPCKPTAPNVSLGLYKQGHDLKYHEIHYPYDPMAGYSMDLVDLTDGGQYQCRTKDGKFTHDIRVVESVPPICSVEGAHVKLGETTIVICECLGYPDSELKWTFTPCLGYEAEKCDSNWSIEMKEENYTAFQMESNNMLPKSDGVQYSHLKLTPNNPGIVTCSANNSAGSAEVHAEIEVRDFEGGEAIGIWRDSNDTIAEGDNVTLTCAASIFKFTNKLVWRCNGSSIELAANVRIDANDTRLTYRRQLHFISIEKDQGRYCECEAFLRKDNSTKYAVIEVAVEELAKNTTDPAVLNVTDSKKMPDFSNKKTLPLNMTTRPPTTLKPESSLNTTTSAPTTLKPETTTRNVLILPLNTTTDAPLLLKPETKARNFSNSPANTTTTTLKPETAKQNHSILPPNTTTRAPPTLQTKTIARQQKKLSPERITVVSTSLLSNTTMENTKTTSASGRTTGTILENSPPPLDIATIPISEKRTTEAPASMKAPETPTISKGMAIELVAFFSFVVLCAIFLSTYVMRKRRLHMELVASGLSNFYDGQREHINPKLALDEQADLMPYDKRYEFPREKLRLDKQLGGGVFGVVVKAFATGILLCEDETTVAVKSVHKSADNQVMRTLVSELKILVHLGQHLNIVNLLGAVTTDIAKRDLMVIVEYCRFGNLQEFLLRHRKYFIDQIIHDRDVIDPMILMKEHSWSSDSCNEFYDSSKNDLREDSTLLSNGSITPDWHSNYKMDYKGPFRVVTTSNLLCWSFQIARGMEFLTSRKVLHGDLAARNILLNDDNIVKICGFGLARSTYKTDNYQKIGGSMLPFKWMAIESIGDRVFSTYSDVWSFGVALWEIFSLGTVPYPGMSADGELYSKLKEGYRMERPEFATKEIYDVMRECWRTHPESRPRFEDLVETLGKLLDSGVAEHYINLNAPYAQINTINSAEGQIDYLGLMASPDFRAPSDSQYIKMGPDVTPPIYLTKSPNGLHNNNTHFRFSTPNPPTESNVPPEEIPMLQR